MTTTDEDKSAFIAVPEGENACWTGWSAVVERLQRAITERCSSKPILVVECYPGVNADEILREFQELLKPTLSLNASTIFHTSKRIETLAHPYVDESKSRPAPSHPLTLLEFFDAERLCHTRREIEDLREGLVLIVGCGASLIAWGHVLVYAGLTRSEARLRLRQKDSSNLGLENHALPAQEKLRLASLVDWPVADRWKRPLITHWDFVLETTQVNAPRLFDGESVQRGLQLAVQRPFQFAAHHTSESPSGPTSLKANGKDLISPGNSHANAAWQEENLVLSFGTMRLELPASDLVMAQSRALLGDAAFLRFGFNCPLPHLPRKLPVSPHQPLHNGEGWSEGRIVLPQPCDAIETRRLHFTTGVLQHTNGGILVLGLVDGPKVSVESPSEAFAPLVFQRGQTFIVPAAVGEFVLRPAGLSQDSPWVLLKAFVQTGTW